MSVEKPYTSFSLTARRSRAEAGRKHFLAGEMLRLLDAPPLWHSATAVGKDARVPMKEIPHRYAGRREPAAVLAAAGPFRMDHVIGSVAVLRATLRGWSGESGEFATE